MGLSNGPDDLRLEEASVTLPRDAAGDAGARPAAFSPSLGVAKPSREKPNDSTPIFSATRSMEAAWRSRSCRDCCACSAMAEEMEDRPASTVVGMLLREADAGWFRASESIVENMSDRDPCSRNEEAPRLSSFSSTSPQVS